MAKMVLSGGTFEYKLPVGIVLAIIFGVIAALTSVVANVGTTDTIVLVVGAVIAGLSAGLSYYQNNQPTPAPTP